MLQQMCVCMRVHGACMYVCMRTRLGVCGCVNVYISHVQLH